MLFINDDLSIPEDELTFKASRAGGPGGQHVNKVSSRVTLCFDIDASPSLTPAQRDRLKKQLGARVSRAGLLRVTSSRHRAQAANRRAAAERLVELLRDALRRRRARRNTAVPAAEKRLRLEQKRRRAKLKQERARVRET